MAKKISKKAKIIGSLSIIAALGAIIILVVIVSDNKTEQPRDNKKESENVQYNKNDLSNVLKDLPDKTALDFICESLLGYWNYSEKFFGFTNEDGKYFVEYGLYATSYGIKGEIINAKVSGENAFSLTLLIPAVSATEADEAKEEKKEIIYIDVSNFNLDNRINAKIENLGDGQWYTYEYGGASLTEAYSD